MQDESPDTLELEVFRAGDYGAKGCWSEEDLDRIAADYDPARHEAPVTLDHRQDGPAQGWVRSLRRVGDRLVACLHRLSPALRRLLGCRAYRKRSIELYRKFGEDGRAYLKAVSFLGAAPPAVKGMTDPLFNEGTDDTVCFVEEFSDTASPSGDGESESLLPGVATARQAPERLVRAGRWNPAWEELGLLDVFAALGEGENLDKLVASLEASPPPVRFGDSVRDEGTALPAGGVDESESRFSGVPSPESVERHRRALALQAAHPELDYRQALLEAAR